MELKNMTNNELKELVDKINTELDNREIQIQEEYKKTLTTLIKNITSEGYTIRIVGYNEEYDYDMTVVIDELYDELDIMIE